MALTETQKSESVEEFYNSIDEGLRLKRKNINQIEFLTTIEYLNKSIKPNSKILDACAGGGIYSFYLADKGHQLYVGDLVEKPESIEKEVGENGLEILYDVATDGMKFVIGEIVDRKV